MPPVLWSQAQAGVDKDMPTRETIIKRFNFITSPHDAKDSNLRVGGEYNFWVTFGDLGLEIELRPLPAKVTFTWMECGPLGFAMRNQKGRKVN